MSNEKKQDYTVEGQGAVEYVVVRCPEGHLNCGQKVGEMKMCVELVCAELHCGLPWTQTIPAIMQLEAVP